MPGQAEPQPIGSLATQSPLLPPTRAPGEPILTPTPDIFTQSMMALPMCLLYEVGILSARLVARKPKPAEA